MGTTGLSYEPLFGCSNHRVNYGRHAFLLMIYFVPHDDFFDTLIAILLVSFILSSGLVSSLLLRT